MASTVWLRVLATVLGALIVSCLSLLFRYRRKGRPFGSRRACARSLAVIGWTTVVAAGVVLGLLKLDPALPVTIGILLPALLCADKFGKPEPVEHSAWYKIATVGVVLLLDHLEEQMYSDRDDWCEAQMSGDWPADKIERAAKYVHAKLEGRISDRARKNSLLSDYEAVLKAVNDARRAHDLRDAEEARFTAEQALIMMLGKARDWGTSISVQGLTTPSPGPTPNPMPSPRRNLSG